MENNNKFDLVVKPQEFFKEVVDDAASKHQINLDSHVEFYIVNLLCDFIDPERHRSDNSFLETPLALMYANALEAPLENQSKLYRNIGDHSLYIAGYFQDFFNKKAFDINYFIAIGSQAYTNVASLIKEKDFSETYENLSKDFRVLVELFAEISDSIQGSHNIDILATYERWQRSDSNRLHKKLKDAGIIPIKSNISSRN